MLFSLKQEAPASIGGGAFTNFKGYVDFFYLQDCVTEDYKQVRFWLGDGNFSNPPLPQTVDEYLAWIATELDFLDKRNARIKAAIEQ